MHDLANAANCMILNSLIVTLRKTASILHVSDPLGEEAADMINAFATRLESMTEELCMDIENGGNHD